MSKCSLALIASLASASVQAEAYAPTQTEWQAVGGSYDGEFTDENHWKGGYPADYEFQAYLPYKSGTSYSVTFSEGVFTNSAAFRAAATDNTSVTLIGTGTDWVIPGGESDIHPAEPWALYWNGYALASLTVTEYAKPVIRFRDFRVRNSVISKAALLDFSEGSFDFGDPEGGSYSTLPTLKMNFKDNPGLSSFELRFGPQTASRLPGVGMNLNAAENTIRFQGGAHEIAGATAIQWSNYGDTSANKQSDFRLIAENGASVTLAGDVSLGCGATLQKRYSVLAQGGSIDFQGEIKQPDQSRGHTFLATDKGTLTFAKASLAAKGSVDIAVTNATFCSKGALQFGPTQAAAASTTPFRFLAKDALIDQSVKATMDLRGDTAFEFANCVWTNCSNKSMGNLNTPGYVSRIILHGGSSYLKEDFHIGCAGAGALVYDGGTHVVDSTTFRLGYNNNATGSLVVSNGTVTFKSAPIVGHRAGCTGELKLFGGTYVSPNLSASHSGTANLIADGGTWKYSGTAALTVTAFDSAVIGDEGFTVDTNGKSLTFDQDFTGTGPLILQGGGSVAFTSGNTVDVPVIVKGGTKLIPNGVEMKGLTMGDETGAATLKVDSTKPLTVDGDVVLTALRLELDGGFAKRDDAYTLITVTGDFSAESAAVWADAMVASGAVPGTASDFIVVESTSGKELMMKVRDPMDLVITVSEGVSNITETITYTDLDSLTADVWADAELTLAGPVKRGPFVKTGAGALKIPDPSLFAVSHNTFRAGAVEFGGDSFFRFAAPFVLSAADDQTQVTVRTADDLAMPLERIEHGALVKDGAGALALEMSNASEIRATVAVNAVNTEIRDGELAFRGLGQQRKLTYSYLYPCIGSPDALFPSAQPGLVLDNVDANFASSSFDFPRITVGTETAIVSPYLYVTNGCKALIGGLQLGADADKSESDCLLRHENLSPHVYVENSVLSLYSTLALQYNRSGRLKMDVTDGSTLEVSRTDMRGDMDLTVDGSVLKGYDRNGGEGNRMAMLAFSFGSGVAFTNNLGFVNGAKLHANYIGITGLDHTNKTAVFRMTFDDARWIPSWDSDFTFSFGQVGTEIFVKGTGLRLAPPEGTVWTMREPVTDAADGAGGLVIDGEGTVVLGGQYRNYTGTTRVLSGTLDLAGDDWTRARIAGKGEIANGALVRPVLDVTSEEPAYVDASALATSVSGRITVDFGRTEDNPLAVGETYKAAEYTGAEPDVSSWRLTGSGIRGVRGRFSCADGVVSVVPEHVGLSIIVR